MKYILLSLLFATQATSQTVSLGVNSSDCPQFFPMAFDVVSDNELITICRNDYAVIYDTVCKIPLVTFENLVITELDGVAPRSSSFKIDPILLDGTSAELQDYYRSGYDRGHMVAAADMRESSASMSETFYLSNVVPQNPTMNRGIWKYLEEYSRSIAIDQGQNETFIITGVVLDKNPQTIGNGFCVPTAMFKVVVGYDIQSFIVENERPSTTQIIYYQSSLREIMRRSDIRFYK